MNVKGGERIRMSAYIVKNISYILNVHVESVKKVYKNLSKIWFTDVDSQQSRLERKSTFLSRGSNSTSSYSLVLISQRHAAVQIVSFTCIVYPMQCSFAI